jgi:tetratricopeptide (TPR) repeat protein
VLRLILNPEEERSPEALAEELASKLEPKADRKQLPMRLANALVLIENVDSDANVRLVVRLLAPLSHARVIVSGRVSDFGEEADWQSMRLRSLDGPTALALFAAWGCPASTTADREALVGLARRLGFLPLALALAAGYIKAGGSVAGFEQELQSTKLAFLPRGSAVLADEEQAARQIIRESFEISLRVFEREAGSVARRALAAMGSALSQEFGESLGRAAAQLEPLEFGRLHMAATKLSLLDWTPSPTSPRYKFHPLIAEFLRNEFDDSAEAFARLRAWFEPRMLGNDARGREELVSEQASLVAWLDRVPDTLAPELSDAYAAHCDANGPYLAFAALHERASEAASDQRGRSLALGRLATVLHYAGELDRSMEVAMTKAELCGNEDPRGRAIALGQVADILFHRGDLDEALRIHTEEEMPVYERLGDVRSRALIFGRIASIRAARGELDEALRIRIEEELPLYETLGRIHDRATALGKVADLLFGRGDLDEALRIRTEEELPVYESLGDVRSRAITLGKVVDILSVRGDFDEALRILHDEVLPTLKRLGAVRETALAQGRVASIRFAQGDFDEALRILKEEELPVYERLGRYP